MYKILIVDDEPYICSGLHALINRIGIPEIGEIFTATNYNVAESIVREQSPDIIITDIKMPEVSGIELIRRFKDMAQEAKFIVLSGYNEFDYVKEGFKLGIVDYLLKPAEKEEMEELLEKVVKVIEMERHQKSKSYDDSQTKWRMLLENSLNRIFYYENPADSDLHIYHELKSFFQYDCFCIGILSISGLLPEKAREVKDRYIDEIRNELVQDMKSQIYCFDNPKNNIVFVFNFSETVFYKGIPGNIKRIIRRLKENQNSIFHFSLGDMDKDILQLRELYERAESVLAYKILFDEDEVIEIEISMHKAADPNIPDFDFEKFERALRDNRVDEINNFIDSLFSKEYLCNLSIEAIEKLYDKVIWYLGSSIENEKALYTQDLFRKVSSFNSLGELRKYVKDTVIRINEMVKQSSTEKTVVEIAKKYVKQNYYKDMDMAVVANTVSVNYTYFSKIFKEETGKTFSEYLIETRMEEAKRLLKDSSKKVYEISCKVGYENSKHFIRAFKKYYEATPEQYRKTLE
jgi:two-component system, response regulator YesN